MIKSFKKFNETFLSSDVHLTKGERWIGEYRDDIESILNIAGDEGVNVITHIFDNGVQVSLDREEVDNETFKRIIISIVDRLSIFEPFRNTNYGVDIDTPETHLMGIDNIKDINKISSEIIYASLDFFLEISE